MCASKTSYCTFLLQLDSDTAVPDDVAGDAGKCVVQVLCSHLIYDGYLCDLKLFKALFLPVHE